MNANSSSRTRNCKKCNELKKTPVLIETMASLEDVDKTEVIVRYHGRSHILWLSKTGG